MKTSAFYRNRQSAYIVFFIALLISLAGCSESSDNMNTPGGGGNPGGSGPGANEVWIQGMSFSPSAKTVAVGTTITWTNKDGTAHTVTSNSGAFGSSTLNTGATYSFTFNAAGTFPYYCSLHTSMTGSIVVQ